MSARPASDPVPGADSLVARFALPPDQIEAVSLQRVDAAIGRAFRGSDLQRAVVRRLVYAAGDPGLADLARFHPYAVEAGLRALGAGAPIALDVRMVEVAVDRARAARLGCAVSCAIDDPDVVVRARSSGLPRAVLAIRSLAARYSEAVFVIGNAPTALLALLDLVDTGQAQPRLVIGMPVGFVAAAEAKAELAARQTPFITIEGTRGGSAVAAATLNALLRLAGEPERHGQ